MYSAFHAKQAPSYDFGVLAIRTIGGECPEWAEGFPPLKGTPTVEILIVREAVIDFASALDTPSGKAPQRVLVVDDALSPEEFECDSAVWLISAPTRDLDVIAEACARLVCGPLMIGVDLGDAIEVAGDHAAMPHFGQGVVIHGNYGDEVRRSLEATVRAFAEARFDGGIFVLQSLSRADEETFDLTRYDALAVQVLGESRTRPTILTAYCGASASAIIAIAFRKADAGQER